MTSDVQNIISATKYRDISVFVFYGDISSDIAAGNLLPVAFVTSRIAPDRTPHTGIWPLEYETPANTRRGRLPFLVNNGNLSSRQRNAGFSRTHCHRWRRSEREASEFGLPPIIDHIPPLAIPGEMGLRPPPCF